MRDGFSDSERLARSLTLRVGVDSLAACRVEGNVTPLIGGLAEKRRKEHDARNQERS